MRFDLIIKSDRIVTPEGTSSGWIGVKGEQIAEIGSCSEIPDTLRLIDARDRIVIPGVIDAHVHCRTSYSPAADTLRDASIAAVCGGVTSMLLHIGPSKGTKPIPGTIYRSVDASGMVAEDYFGSIIREGEGSSLIDFGIHCMLPPDLSFISQIPNIVRMGITSFKMMLGYHPLRGWTLDDFLLMKVLDLIGSSGGIAMFHCENGNAVGFLEDRLLAAGTYDPEHFLSSRPSLLESETLNRVSILCQLTNCPMYVVHLSSSEGLSALKEALQRGANITSETCPQYLLLSESDTIAQGARCKMAPPLRRPADNKALWQALGDGTINIAASDHAPWNLQNQKLSATDFASVPFGAPGVETLLPLLFSEGVSRGNLSLVRMVEILCLNPARKLGLYPKKGVIAKGSDADIAIIDPKKHWRVDESLLHSKAGYSAFHGWPMTGAPMTTVVKGKVVVEEGVLLDVPAYGRFLNRSPYKSGSSI